MIELEVDTRQFRELERKIRAAGKSTTPALARAIKRVGDTTRTAMIRALVAQTGLKRKVLVRALKKKGGRGSLSYVIASRGGDISLKYFAARETRKGVTAAPFGARKLFPGTFIKGGRFPKRVALRLGGHVFERQGSSRFPIEKVKSGVIIPREMVRGASATAFNSTIRVEFPKRIAHELGRILNA